MHQAGAIELEMPNLQVYREGAPVHQFVTQHPISGEKYYLRHCMEDHLKRICPSFGRVYEIGKAYRVETEDEFRAIEFTVMEFVGMDIDYGNGIDIVRHLIEDVVAASFNTTDFATIDLSSIQTTTFDELMVRQLGYGMNDPQFREKSCERLVRLGINVGIDVPEWEVFEHLLKHFLEPSIHNPTMIIDFPLALQHVAEIDHDRQIAQRFSVIINGIEICDGGKKFCGSKKYKEVYDRNAEYRLKVLGITDNEEPFEYFQDIDNYSDSIFTFGLGIDRLFALCTNKTIHEVILFPFH